MKWIAFIDVAKAICGKMPLDTDLWYVFLPETLVVIGSCVVMPILLYYIFKKYRPTKFLFGL